MRPVNGAEGCKRRRDARKASSVQGKRVHVHVCARAEFARKRCACAGIALLGIVLAVVGAEQVVGAVVYRMLAQRGFVPPPFSPQRAARSLVTLALVTLALVTWVERRCGRWVCGLRRLVCLSVGCVVD